MPTAENPREPLKRVVATIQFTPQFSVTGQPAISLPLHWNAQGLPMGIQLVAPVGGEEMLLRIAAQLEAVRPWDHRRAAIHG
jgi:amidase